MELIKLVWDTSALINIKEPGHNGYTPARSLWKDLSDGWIKGPHLNIVPALAAFEINATVSKKHRKKQPMLREFYIVDENFLSYPIDDKLISRSAALVELEGFIKLHGADLVFACIAKIEGATLVTLDNHYQAVADQIDVLDLNLSKLSPAYRDRFSDRMS